MGARFRIAQETVSWNVEGQMRAAVDLVWSESGKIIYSCSNTVSLVNILIFSVNRRWDDLE